MRTCNLRSRSLLSCRSRSGLSEFLESNYLRMSCGGLLLDVSKSLEHSKTLREIEPVSEKVVRKYIHIWKEIGFLETTQEDRDGFEKERKMLWE